MKSQNLNTNARDFSISNYLEFLTPASNPSKKAQKKYVCPACDQENLSINQDGKRYNCYSCEDTSLIAQELIRLKKESESLPEKKTPRKEQTTEFVYKDVNGYEIAKVVRIDSNQGKKFYQLKNLNGQWEKGRPEKTLITPYNWENVDPLKPVYLVEGESTCETVRLAGHGNCITLIGGTSGWSNHYLTFFKDKGVNHFILCPDKDQKGVNYMEKVEKALQDNSYFVQWCYCYPDSPLWSYEKLKNSEGVDFVDYFKDFKTTELPPATSEKLHLKVKTNVTNIKTREPVEILRPEEIIHNATQEFRELINKGASDSEINQCRAKHSQLFRSYGINEPSPRDIYNQLYSENERKEDLTDSIDQFKRLNGFNNTVLDLNSFFPSQLANPLMMAADAARLDPALLLQDTLGAIATMIGCKPELVLKEGVTEKDDYTCHPIMYLLKVAPPSLGKSASESIIYRYIKDLQGNELQRVIKKRKELDTVKLHWLAMDKKERAEYSEDPDKNPVLFEETYLKEKKWIINSGTPEGILRQVANQKSFESPVLLFDEITRILTLDQYKSNQGDSRQTILENWNKPTFGKMERSESSKAIYFTGQGFHISGGLQPEMAKKLFNSTTDGDGFLSRFLPVCAQYHKDFDKWSDKKVSLYELLKDLLDNLALLCQYDDLKIKMNPEAKELYKAYWTQLKKGCLQYSDINPAYSNFLGKQDSQVGRLALLLHLVKWHYLDDMDMDIHTLDAETMQRAIALNKFYCGQFRLLQSGSESKADLTNLDGVLLKIWQRCQKAGEVDARYVANKISRGLTWQGKKINSAIAKELLESLSLMGYGFLTEDKKKLILTQRDPKVTQTDPSSKTLISKDFQENVTQSDPNVTQADPSNKTLISKDFQENLTQTDPILPPPPPEKNSLLENSKQNPPDNSKEKNNLGESSESVGQNGLKPLQDKESSLGSSLGQFESKEKFPNFPTDKEKII